jgi:hypothetical protein
MNLVGASSVFHFPHTLVFGLCFNRADIYSLGVIIIELYHPFHTEMERAKVLKDVRSGIMPSKLREQLKREVCFRCSSDFHMHAQESN